MSAPTSVAILPKSFHACSDCSFGKPAAYSPSRLCRPVGEVTHDQPENHQSQAQHHSKHNGGRSFAAPAVVPVWKAFCVSPSITSRPSKSNKRTDGHKVFWQSTALPFQSSTYNSFADTPQSPHRHHPVEDPSTQYRIQTHTR